MSNGANQEKEQALNRRYREAHRDEIRERNRKYYKANAEKQREYQRRYREAHPDYRRQWFEANREARAEYKRQWGMNPRNAIGNCMSTGISKSLADGKNGRHWEDLVGYTCEDRIDEVPLPLLHKVAS